jgi:hypothetical protein
LPVCSARPHKSHPIFPLSEKERDRESKWVASYLKYCISNYREALSYFCHDYSCSLIFEPAVYTYNDGKGNSYHETIYEKRVVVMDPNLHHHLLNDNANDSAILLIAKKEFEDYDFGLKSLVLEFDILKNFYKRFNSFKEPLCYIRSVLLIFISNSFLPLNGSWNNYYITGIICLVFAFGLLDPLLMYLMTIKRNNELKNEHSKNCLNRAFWKSQVQKGKFHLSDVNGVLHVDHSLCLPGETLESAWEFNELSVPYNCIGYELMGNLFSTVYRVNSGVIQDNYGDEIGINEGHVPLLPIKFTNDEIAKFKSCAYTIWQAEITFVGRRLYVSNVSANTRNCIIKCIRTYCHVNNLKMPFGTLNSKKNHTKAVSLFMKLVSIKDDYHFSHSSPQIREAKEIQEMMLNDHDIQYEVKPSQKAVWAQKEILENEMMFLEDKTHLTIPNTKTPILRREIVRTRNMAKPPKEYMKAIRNFKARKFDSMDFKTMALMHDPKVFDIPDLTSVDFYQVKCRERPSSRPTAPQYNEDAVENIDVDLDRFLTKGFFPYKKKIIHKVKKEYVEETKEKQAKRLEQKEKRRIKREKKAKQKKKIHDKEGHKSVFRCVGRLAAEIASRNPGFELNARLARTQQKAENMIFKEKYKKSRVWSFDKAFKSIQRSFHKNKGFIKKWITKNSSPEEQIKIKYCKGFKVEDDVVHQYIMRKELIRFIQERTGTSASDIDVNIIYRDLDRIKRFGHKRPYLHLKGKYRKVLFDLIRGFGLQ